MRLGTLLVLGSLAAGLPPLVLLGVAATEVATRAVTDRVFALHAQEADNLATFIDSWILGRVQAMTLLRGAFPLEGLPDDALTGFERLVYNQFEEVNIAVLVDGGGADLVPSLRVVPGGRVPPDHDAVDDPRLEAFRAHLPSLDPSRAGPSLGAPYLPPGGDHHVVAVVIPGPGGDGIALGVELSLAPVEARLADLASPTTEIVLLDAQGQPFVGGGDTMVDPERFSWFLEGVPAAQLQYRLADGEKVMAAFCRVQSTGWLAVVAEPWDRVVAPARGIRLRAAWFGLVALGLAGVLGHHFARKLHRPVVALRDATRTLEQGGLGCQVASSDVSELRDLAEAFNTMSAQLARDAQRIAAQHAEIQAFNAMLQRKVEERTRDLVLAQERLIESERLAAVAELGAGLAHELNNPLASVLGLTQLLAQRPIAPADAALLATVEQQVARCAEIVRSLLAFTDEGTRRTELGVLDLDALLGDVVTLVGPAFRQRGLALHHVAASEPLPVRADRARLGQALAQLVASLRLLLPEGGFLDLRGRIAAGQVEVALLPAGDAPGDPRPPRDDWLAAGMSLWIARRILSEHGGHLREPDPAVPGPFVLSIPRA